MGRYSIFVLLFLVRIGAACPPVRLSVEVARDRAAMAGQTLEFHVRLKDEKDQVCPAPYDYGIHVEISSGKMLISKFELRIPRGQAEADPRATRYTTRAAGIVSVRASGAGLRDGIASVLVHSSGVIEPPPVFQQLARVRLIPATYSPEQDPEPAAPAPAGPEVNCYCESGGQVYANDQESILVTAELTRGRAPERITINAALKRLPWKGDIVVDKDAQFGKTPITSMKPGTVELEVLRASPAHIPAKVWNETCQGVEFIDEAQYAEFETGPRDIVLGHYVPVRVRFRNLQFRQVNIQNASDVDLELTGGSRTDVTVSNGIATFIFKPDLLGTSQIGQRGKPTVGWDTSANQWRVLSAPVQLRVHFPWSPLILAICCGAFGGLLSGLRSYLQGGEKRPHWLAIKLLFGVAGAMVLIALAIGVSLLKADFQLNFWLDLAIALTGGVLGLAAFDLAIKIAIKLKLLPDVDIPGDGAADAAAAHG